MILIRVLLFTESVRPFRTHYACPKVEDMFVPTHEQRVLLGSGRPAPGAELLRALLLPWHNADGRPHYSRYTPAGKSEGL
jgi:hypothetical protein